MAALDQAALAGHIAALEADQSRGNAIKAQFETYIRDSNYRQEVDGAAAGANMAPVDVLLARADPQATDQERRALAVRAAALEADQRRGNAIKAQFETYIRDGNGVYRQEVDAAVAGTTRNLADELIARAEASLPADAPDLALRAAALHAAQDLAGLADYASRLDADQRTRNATKAEFERYIREGAYRQEVDAAAAGVPRAPADELIARAEAGLLAG
jgi:hypothetical protein